MLFLYNMIVFLITQRIVDGQSTPPGDNTAFSFTPGIDNK